MKFEIEQFELFVLYHNFLKEFGLIFLLLAVINGENDITFCYLYYQLPLGEVDQIIGDVDLLLYSFVHERYTCVDLELARLLRPCNPQVEYHCANW